MLAALYYLMSATGARMFWPFMILTYLMAIPVYLYEVNVRKDGTVKKGLFNYLFSKELWLHTSAKQDYFIILVNLAMTATIFHYVVFNPEFFYHIGWAIMSVLPFLKDLGQSEATPSLLVIGIYTLCAFLMSDLFYYFAHRLLHRIPWLWEFHKVHHSAKVMTPATLHRAHPVDLWLSVSFRFIGLGLTSGVFYYLYPNMSHFMTIMGVNVLLIFVYIIGANLRHSHIWLPYGPVIEHVLMSPAQHQIHHSEKVKHYDKNFGSGLSLWDWMFGSLYVVRGKENLTYGLASRKEEEDLNSVWKLYMVPFKKAAKILSKKKEKPEETREVQRP